MAQKGSDIDDEPEQNYDILSREQLSAKIKQFRNLCLTNKINTSNAFDIDMIGYFSTWLIKHKSPEDINVESFQEIADYLDASGKIYGLRVDNYSLETSKLVEEFRAMYFKKNMLNAENEIKMSKPRKPKMMLTTAEKLKYKVIDSDNFNDPTVKQEIFHFSFKDLFESNSPSNYFSSLYNNYSLEEERERVKCRKFKNDDQYFGLMPDLNRGLDKRHISTKFSNFVTESDQESINLLREEFQIEDFENHFDPEDNIFHSSSLDDENIKEIELTSNENDNQSEIAGLVECIDDVKRDYSFFNPQRLANWKGPKTWKAQAMMRALKSCNSSEQKDVASTTNILDDIEEIITEIKKSKQSNRKRTKRRDNDVSIKWQTKHQILKEGILKLRSKELIAPRTINKWNCLDNIIDKKNVVGYVSHKFQFMRYHEIIPYWRLEKNKTKNSIISSPIHQDDPDSEADYVIINENGEEVTPHEELISIVTMEHNELLDSNEPNKTDDDLMNELKSESKMDIGELKKKISKVIDQECIEDINSDKEWSRKLLFSKLLDILNVIQDEKLTIPIVFVGLLHLTNERGLKLFEEHCNEIDERDIVILKPLNKV